MPFQDIYLDEKGKLVQNFRPAVFGVIDGDQTPLHYAAKAGLIFSPFFSQGPQCCKAVLFCPQKPVFFVFTSFSAQGSQCAAGC